MSDELLPAAKAIEELEPAFQAFADATGLLAPVRELATWATDLIRYRRAPHQAKLLMSAAEKVRASGLPPSAVSDKLLRAALEDGAMEDDPGMQERWANLLANAGTGSPSVRVAFPKMLSEMEPDDAAILDRAYEIGPSRPLQLRGEEVDFLTLDNVSRLGLVGYSYTPKLPVAEVSLTPTGRAFVQACREPRPAD